MDIAFSKYFIWVSMWQLLCICYLSLSFHTQSWHIHLGSRKTCTGVCNKMGGMLVGICQWISFKQYGNLLVLKGFTILHINVAVSITISLITSLPWYSRENCSDIKYPHVSMRPPSYCTAKKCSFSFVFEVWRVEMVI